VSTKLGLSPLVERLFVGAFVVPESLESLIVAAQERELALIRERQAAELGCVVFRGAIMTQEDADRDRLGLPREPIAPRLAALIAELSKECPEDGVSK